MTPYREAHVTPGTWRGGRSRRWTARRKFAGILLAVVAARATTYAWPCEWAIAVWGACVMVGLLVAWPGRSRTPYTRLCALQWNRGDRFGAALLFFNVIGPRYSPKRIARNKAELEEVRARMPKRRFLRFHFVDYDD